MRGVAAGGGEDVGFGDEALQGQVVGEEGGAVVTVGAFLFGFGCLGGGGGVEDGVGGFGGLYRRKGMLLVMVYPCRIRSLGENARRTYQISLQLLLGHL